MEKENKIKINLKTAIAVIVGLLIIVALVIVSLFNTNSNSNNTVGQNNNTLQNQNQKVNSENDYEFAMKFLKLENNNKNKIYSPLSIKYALNMLNEGAEGNTKAQIENLLENVNLTRYNNINKVLSLANGVYIRDTYKQFINNEYNKTLQSKYNAEIKFDSFNNANNINKWIENKTLGIIKNMIKDSVVQEPDTKMLLINALAIDMEWQESFEDDNTHGADFYLSDGNKMTATTMNKETSSNSVSYYKNEEITSLTMDLKKYGNTQLEFTAIMPNDNLANYIDDFTADELNTIVQNSKKASSVKNGIHIFIPKFSFDYDLKLKDDLIKLGMEDAFDEDLANFTDMTTEGKELYVGDALHKANIDFTEKGVKAAAVTAIIMLETSAMMQVEQKEEVRIDKPFMYIIRDKNNGEIWFVGTVYEPNSWENDKADYRG